MEPQCGRENYDRSLIDARRHVGRTGICCHGGRVGRVGSRLGAKPPRAGFRLHRNLNGDARRLHGDRLRSWLAPAAPAGKKNTRTSGLVARPLGAGGPGSGKMVRFTITCSVLPGP
jgi:hypothetical protein